MQTQTQTRAQTRTQLVTFTLDRLHFGVEVSHVQEVIRYQTMTRVPRAPAVVEGLINLRGQIVTAVDMRARVGLGKRDGSRLPMNVVIRSADGVASLLVDEIGEVVEVDAAQLEPAPLSVSDRIRDVIGGVYKLHGMLLLELDVERALTI
jgi:purine-binding chemotaxis protein CheW